MVWNGGNRIDYHLPLRIKVFLLVLPFRPRYLEFGISNQPIGRKCTLVEADPHSFVSARIPKPQFGNVETAVADGQAPAGGPVKGELRESRGQPVSEHVRKFLDNFLMSTPPMLKLYRARRIIHVQS